MKKSRQHKTSRTTSILFLLLNVLLWGAALPIVKPALDSTSPFLFLFYRFVLAAVLSFPILIYYWPKVDRKKHAIFKIIISESIGTTLALGLLYAGLERTSALEASLIATTTPIFITIGGVLWLKEKLESHEMAGLFLAFGGTLLLTIEPLFLGGTLNFSGSTFGNLLVFLQNLATAVYFLIAKKHYKGIPKLFVTSISFYVGLISFFIISYLEFEIWNLEFSSFPSIWSFMQTNLSTPSVQLAVFYMALFGSIIGLTAYIKGQDGIEASEAGIFTYLQPLIFIPLAVIWLKESLTITSVIAVILITCGVVLAEFRKRTLIKKK